MKKEIFYNSTKIEGYEIHNDGRLFSLKSNIFLKARNHSGGYLMVTLWAPKQKECFIHKLVAEAFVSNALNLPQVNHKDGDKTNNNDWNLEWTTDSDNKKHAYRTGLNNRNGSNNGKSKLNREKVLHIRQSLLSSKELAKLYSVSSTTINAVKSNKSWTHI